MANGDGCVGAGVSIVTGELRCCSLTFCDVVVAVLEFIGVVSSGGNVGVSRVSDGGSCVGVKDCCGVSCDGGDGFLVGGECFNK